MRNLMAHSWGVASEHVVEEVHKVAQDLVPGGGARMGWVGGVLGWEGGSRLQGLPGLGHQHDWWLGCCLRKIQKVIRTLKNEPQIGLSRSLETAETGKHV